jgi:hypothetical protein
LCHPKKFLAGRVAALRLKVAAARPQAHAANYPRFHKPREDLSTNGDVDSTSPICQDHEECELFLRFSWLQVITNSRSIEPHLQWARIRCPKSRSGFLKLDAWGEDSRRSTTRWQHSRSSHIRSYFLLTRPSNP